MNKRSAYSLTFRSWANVLGGLLLAFFSGICFFSVSAQTEIAGNPANQNLVLGRLLYTSTNFSQFGITGNILTANADGSGQNGVSTSTILPNQPTWTADGAKILYSQSDIFVVAGGGDINLTNTGSVTENSPSCSVTGKIAYVRAGEIWLMNADGSGQAKFSSITQPWLDSPAWSPDGTKLAFVSGGEIWKINADGSNQQRVTTNSTSDVDPAWSPDGLKIVFGGGGSGIKVINADGTNEVAVTSNFVDIQPSWSPDGTKIAFRRSSGDRGVYTMDPNGANQIRIIADSGSFPNPSLVRENPEWQPLPLLVSRRAAFDFDGDGRSDVSGFRPSNGTWYTSPDAATNYGAIQFGAADDKIVPADYDGDRKTDVAVYRNGVWYLLQSTNGFASISFGLSSDIPAPADYDGDGKADLAVFRPSNGTWYLLQSTLGFAGVKFGQTGDRPAAADYDGDGKTDLAVNRGGIWYIQRSSLGFYSLEFGYGDDKLVPADYDGDGRADIAVFRSVEGTWYIQRSSAGFFSIRYDFGFNFDIPVPADYDGDGKTDIAFVRTNTWFLNRSAAGFTSVPFGVNNDKPVPNAYVR